MHILLIGSGGREHALAYALKKSKQVGTLFALPGNAGIHSLCTPVDLKDTDAEGIIAFCKKETIGLVVIGPEAPLVAGLADKLEAAGIPVFGPSAKAAQLEGSKKFTKDLCKKYNLPTGAYDSFTDAASAKKYIDAQNSYPTVIKADGLAAGKGVIIAQNKAEAYKAIDEMFGGKFGDAGKLVVIEEFLDGEEASYFALSDGTTAIAFGSAQDHKRVGDGDTGPNTGGMGTYSPAPCVTKAIDEEVMRTIMQPAITAMKKEGMPFKGVLFAGLMLTKKGPKLIEFNARFGDPETQVLMLRLESDLVELMLACAKGNLEGKTVKLSSKAAVCVVMAAKGYPDTYVKNTEIKNIAQADQMEGVKVFHAGTKREAGKILAIGGRVLGVTAIGATVAEAQKRAYSAVDAIHWPEGFCRRDIAWRAIAQTKNAI
ncbi:MAG: phosphoribosylamine--glycine ligase [Proteobacteria bacterium]|nr:phosphoribosylamine--glycine ligase [Pseudomonadota bacterium]